MRWKDQDSAQRAVTVAILSCIMTALGLIASTVVSLYIWSHPVNPNHPPVFGFPAWFWTILGSWGPPLLSGGFAVVSATTFRAVKRLQPARALIASHHKELQTKDDLIAKLANREQLYLLDQQQSAGKINHLTNAAHADQQRISNLESDAKSLTAQIDSYKRNFQAVQDELDALKKTDQAQILIVKNKKLDELLNEKDLVLTTANRQVEELKEVVSQSETNSLSKEKRIKDLERTQAELNSSIREYQQKLTETDKRRAVLQQQIDSLQLTAPIAIPVTSGPFTFDGSLKGITTPSPNRVHLEIRRHQTKDLWGLLAYLFNETDEKLGTYSISIIASGQWSNTHKKFIFTSQSPKASLNGGKEIEPMHNSITSWVVTTMDLPMMQGQPLQPLKLAGGNTPLDWTIQEEVKTEIWNLAIEYTYLTKQQTQHTERCDLVISWNRETAELLFADGTKR